MVLEPGARVSGCEVVTQLGAGGMASIHLVRDIRASGFHRYWAMKMVQPSLLKEERFLRMFVDEARICSMIDHPNVARIEEFGTHEGVPYMMIEFINGCTLSKLLRKLYQEGRRMTAPLAAYFVMEIAKGLHAAHSAKDPDQRPLDIVHRDVSPENILLGYSGHVKLIDFGIARAEIERDRTEAGQLKGKLSYMSPEQANASRIDQRSDIYSLGIVLWETLVGKRLFRGTTAELLEKIRRPEIKCPSVFVPSISRELDDVVMQALAPRPRDRFASAADFRRALAAAVPESHLLDSADVSNLLTTLMRDEIEEMKAHLLPIAKDAFSISTSMPVQEEAFALTTQMSTMSRESTMRTLNDRSAPSALSRGVPTPFVSDTARVKSSSGAMTAQRDPSLTDGGMADQKSVFSGVEDLNQGNLRGAQFRTSSKLGLAHFSVTILLALISAGGAYYFAMNERPSNVVEPASSKPTYMWCSFEVRAPRKKASIVDVPRGQELMKLGDRTPLSVVSYRSDWVEISKPIRGYIETHSVHRECLESKQK